MIAINGVRPAEGFPAALSGPGRAGVNCPGFRSRSSQGTHIIEGFLYRSVRTMLFPIVFIPLQQVRLWAMFRSINPLTEDEAGIRFVLLPLATAKRWTANVLVAEHVLDCTAFLGQKNDRGEFNPHGTAFFVGLTAYQRTKPYIVTAKHVLDQIPGDMVPLRVNTISNSGVRYIPLAKSSWHFHPAHDEKKITLT